MRLHWSSRSPFVRKVMVVAHEAGLTDRIERVPTVVALTRPGLDLLPTNPLGKIPTLVLEDGTALYDSVVICEYLDGLSGQPLLFPPAGPARIEALRRHALGNGCMDMLLLFRTEMGRDQPDRRILDGFAAKQAAVLAALEREAPALADTPFGIGQVAIGCALSYLDFRWPQAGWRGDHPALAAWHEGFSARPSVQATAHIDA
ncbi:glutathione S-transferase [Paracraurococcus ruber]|uniref:Glutathione S-transferase n=2 Tax=Paracraurococcus ruber TaxID=77675 RepID=A0ABS1CZ75_9PROT|nr:glutathione S-transferase [Paracraurococcus ruber]TDG29838.1 glutathione S-transferase [Paracraurococcus ruber]